MLKPEPMGTKTRLFYSYYIVGDEEIRRNLKEMNSLLKSMCVP